MSNRILDNLLKNCLFPSDLGITAKRVFSCISNSESTPLDLVKIIEQNQAFTHFILSLGILKKRAGTLGDSDENKKKTDKIDDKELEKTILLLGKYATRNLVFDIRMSRIVSKNLPKNETDRFNLAPQDRLKYALLAEDYCQEHRLAHTEMAFAAGLHYDWLISIFNSSKDSPKEAKNAITTIWKNGLSHALVAYNLAILFKKLKYSKFVFSGGLILPLGNILMTWSYPKGTSPLSYGEFLQQLDEYKDSKHDIMLMMERKHFPVCHNEALSLYVSFLSFFAPVEKAFFYYSESYFLKTIDLDLYLLASIYSMTERLVPIIVSKDKKNIKNLPLTNENWKCLNDYKITEKDLVTLISLLIDKQE